MRQRTAAGLTWRELSGLAGSPGCGHAFSGRVGGVSAPPFASLNLALHVGDAPAAVHENRRRLALALGLAPGRLVFADQVHGGQLALVTAADAGRTMPAVDALATNTPGLALVVLVADCVPILLHDPRCGAVAAAHAGWRGTLADIAGATVRALGAAYGSRPAELRAGLGPAIAAEDYEVGPEVLDALRAVFPGRWRELVQPTRPGHARLDLLAANRALLLAAGLRPERIESAGVSTFRATTELFSARAEGARTGRFGAVIWRADGW